MIDAMKMALAALETCDVDYDYDENPYNTFDAEDVSEAIEALRQAIEQAEQWDTSDMAHRSGGLSVEQEPVAWAETNDMVCALLRQAHDVLACASSSPPPKREVEQEPVAYKYTDKTNPLVFYFTTHKDSLPNPDVIETALYTAPSKRDMSTKPQNVYTSAERVQEIDKSIHEDDDIAERAYFAGKEAGVAESEAVKRKWVGLTEKEITTIANKTLTFKQCVQAIEAKLKEKNNG